MLLARKFGVAPEDIKTGRANEMIRRRTLEWIAESRVDRVVLLAFDRVWRRDGTADDERTLLHVANDCVSEAARHNEKVLFGASVHPYRKDALDALDRAFANGAVLVKWLPSAQGIAPDDPACFPFYDKLCELRLPLLCHLGKEHTLSNFDDSLNRPVRLEPALQRGVTVVGAHLGARLVFHERCWMREWADLARKYENLYGDISAFCSPIRSMILSRVLKDPLLARRILFGSDFPADVLPAVHMLRIGPVAAAKLHFELNPFDRAFRTIRASGLPGDAFRRASAILRLPRDPDRDAALHTKP